jgi:hypothetical protein
MVILPTVDYLKYKYRSIVPAKDITEEGFFILDAKRMDV